MSTSPPTIGWHPISSGTPRAKLMDALVVAFDDMPAAARVYAGDIPQLNGLFDWISQENPWRVAAFVMHHGIGPDLKAYSYEEIAEHVGHSKRAVQAAVSGKATLNNILSALRIAHFTLRDAPAEARLKNEFRDPLGLKPNEWRPLVHEKIFTIDQLCQYGLHEISDLRGVGPERLALIERKLNGLTPKRSLRR